LTFLSYNKIARADQNEQKEGEEEDEELNFFRKNVIDYKNIGKDQFKIP